MIRSPTLKFAAEETWKVCVPTGTKASVIFTLVPDTSSILPLPDTSINEKRCLPMANRRVSFTLSPSPVKITPLAFI